MLIMMRINKIINESKFMIVIWIIIIGNTFDEKIKNSEIEYDGVGVRLQLLLQIDEKF
jgi:hypothetical protein